MDEYAICEGARRCNVFGRITRCIRRQAITHANHCRAVYSRFPPRCAADWRRKPIPRNGSSTSDRYSRRLRVCQRRQRSVKRIGIDVGGTFTDVVMVDDSTGKVLVDQGADDAEDASWGRSKVFEGFSKSRARRAAIFHSLATERQWPRTWWSKARARKLRWSSRAGSGHS